MPEVSAAALSNPAEYRIVRDLAELAREQTGASGAAIALEDEGHMVCRATAGSIAPDLGATINTSTGLSGACVMTGRTQWCVNTEDDPRVNAEVSRHLGVRSILAMPLFDGQKVVGVFEVVLLGAVVLALAFVLALGAGFYWGWQQAIAQQTTGTTTTADKSVGFIQPEVRERAPAKRGMIRGRLIHGVAPTYPSQALEQRLEGPVLLDAEVSKDGLVRDVSPVRGPALLAQAASEAVGQWRFEPYKLNGKPIDMPAQITIQFGLPK